MVCLLPISLQFVSLESHPEELLGIHNESNLSYLRSFFPHVWSVPHAFMSRSFQSAWQLLMHNENTPHQTCTTASPRNVAMTA